MQISYHGLQTGRLYHNLTEHGKMVDRLPYQVQCSWLAHAVVYIKNLSLCQKQSRGFRCFPSPGNGQLPEQQRPCQRFLLSRPCIQNSWHPLREAELTHACISEKLKEFIFIVIIAQEIFPVAGQLHIW